MSKRAYIFYLATFVSGFIVAYLMGVKIGMNEGKTLTEQVVNVTPQKEDSTERDGYWVQIHNDKVIVYKSDKTTVVAETDININDYSESEQNILQNGVYLETSEELFKFLEANTS